MVLIVVMVKVVIIVSKKQNFPLKIWVYYCGLKEFERVPEYLLNICHSAHDAYQQWVDYFSPEK